MRTLRRHAWATTLLALGFAAEVTMLVVVR